MALAATLTSAQQTKQAPPLKLNETLERELAGSEVHEYLVTLKANEFVQVRVEQKGIDVEVKLYTEDHWMLAEMDSPSGKEGFETLSWIAKYAGTYRFRVSRLEEEGNAESGKYSITLTAKNAATEANRRRLKAEHMFLQIVKTPVVGIEEIPVRIKQYETLLAVWQELKDEQIVSLIESIIARLRELQTDSEGETRPEEEAARKAKLVVQTNHGLLIQSVAFSLDGKILATGGGDGVIKLWDVETGRQLRSNLAHPGTKMMSWEEPVPAKSKDWLVRIFEEMDGGVGQTVQSLAFSPDGKTLASGSSDKTIRIWELATGKQLKLFTQPIRVWLIAFNPDGSKLLSIADDGSYRYWDVAGGKEIKDNPPPLSSFRLPWQSPLGKLMAVYGESDKTISIIDSTTNRKKILEGHEAGVRRAIFSPDGRTLASCGWDRTVRLWDMKGEKKTQVLRGHTSFVSSVAFSPDGKLLASVGGDLSVKLWVVESGKELKTLRGFGDYVDPHAFGKDDKILMTSMGNILHVWDLEKGVKFGSAPVHSGNVNITLFSPNNKFLATSDQDVLTIAEMARLPDLLNKSPGDTVIRSLQSSLGLAKGILRLPGAAEFGEADKRLSSDKVIRLWDVETGNRLKTFRGHSEDIESLAFSPDSTVLASSSNDRTIRLWSTETDKEPTVINTKSPVRAIAFDRGGKTLVGIGEDEIVRLWDVASGQLRRELKAPPNRSLSSYSWARWIGFSSDEKKILSFNSEYVFRVWDVESGRLEDTFSGDEAAKRNYLLSLVPDIFHKVYPHVTSDQKFMVKGGSGGKVSLYDVASGKLLAWLIALSEKDWAVITPAGLFDASLGARKQMHYVIGLEAITLEQMKDLYYVPSLLSIIFKGQPLPKVDLFSNEDLFPLAEYQPPQPGQKTFTVKLINRGGGIGHVQVIINDKECGGDARPANFDPNQPSLTLQIDLDKCGLLVPGRQNRVEVVARNAAGSLNSRGSSRGVEIVGLFDGEAKAEPPNIYAIVGGVSDYTGNDLDLSYAAKDAEDFAKALEVGASKLFGADKVHIRLLTSHGNKSNVKFSTGDAKISAATKPDFQRAFDEFKNATPTDIFIVYLAGHGVSLNINQTTSQAGGGLYLYLTQEATTTDASVLAVEHSRKAMAISSDELAELIKQNKALKQVLILDTCAAGAAARSLIGRRDLPSDQIKAIDRLQDRIGFFVLMGSAADRVSYETTQYSQGLLTYSLLKGMKGSKLRDGKFADVSELFIYAQDTVPRLAKNIGGIQRPIVISPERERSVVFGESGSFDIGMFTAKEQEAIKIAAPKPFVLRPTLINLKLSYDDLDLTPLLREALREAGDIPESGGTEPSLSFVDADEMIDAVRLSGLYTIEGEKVLVTMRLIRNKLPLDTTLIIEGKLGEKEQLIKQIVAAIVRTDFPK
jgi:WD40 repeat protein/uncharacterized caspase-like protein